MCQTSKEVESKEHFRQKNQHVQKHSMCRKIKGMHKSEENLETISGGAWYMLGNLPSNARVIRSNGVCT